MSDDHRNSDSVHSRDYRHEQGFHDRGTNHRLFHRAAGVSCWCVSCCVSVNKTCRRNSDRESRIAAVCPQDMQDSLPGIEPACSNPTPQTTLPPYTSREDLPQYEEAPPYHELPPIVGYPEPQPRYPQDPEEYRNRSTYLYPTGVTTEDYQPPPSYEEAVNSAK
ncbi:uncharacterized protein LOC118429262 [Branchiostoma floridae]|uniref:Uncharacterized protein LOC118429262 n=1 Tax=Branchiostoma floridae TaxID=7739 RepID=A0A9J7NAC5_BRAFL|nr:uncharacterized protein LOC118429262 [Branchiostoma floridae]